MKRYLVLMLGLAMLAACEEPGGGKDTHTILVQVFDTDNRPVAGASVFIQGQLVDKQTGQDGSVQFEQKLSAPSIGLRVSLQDYVDHVQTVDLGEGSMRLVVSAWLSRVGTSQTIDPLVVSTVSDVDARVDIPPSSFVDETGDPVTGPVEVEFTFIPPGENLRSVGSFRIQGRPDEILLSLGVVSITATSEGKPVNLAPGASVRMSIPDSQTGGNPPAEMPPVWRQNPETGNWEQASMDWSNEAGEWVAQVDALATWNCDYPSSVTCVEGSVMGPNTSMAGTAISGTMSGTAADFLPASTVQTATTGSDGRFCMEVVPGSQLDLSLTCPGGDEVSVGSIAVPEGGGARCGQGGCSQLPSGSIDCCFTDEDCPAEQSCQQGSCRAEDTEDMCDSCDTQCQLSSSRAFGECGISRLTCWCSCPSGDGECHLRCEDTHQDCLNSAESSSRDCNARCDGCLLAHDTCVDGCSSEACEDECVYPVFECTGWDMVCYFNCPILCCLDDCDGIPLCNSCERERDECTSGCMGCSAL